VWSNLIETTVPVDQILLETHVKDKAFPRYVKRKQMRMNQVNQCYIKIK